MGSDPKKEPDLALFDSIHFQSAATTESNKHLSNKQQQQEPCAIRNVVS
jgi:hypothetical protein